MGLWIFSSTILSALGLVFTLILLIAMLSDMALQESVYRASVTTFSVYCGIMIWGLIYYHVLKPAIDYEDEETPSTEDLAE